MADETVVRAAGAPRAPVGDAELLATAGQLFTDIAWLASRMERQCFYTPDHDDPEAADLKNDALLEVVRKMGWIADRGASLAGLGPVRSTDADEWLLSPETRSRLAASAP